jgi:hypothetical protein
MSKPADDARELVGLFESESELFPVVIKCHHSIEQKLNATLQEALLKADVLDIERVTFLLKVDFLIALGVLQSKERSLFEQLNKVRNLFAHNPHAILSDARFADIRSALGGVDRSYVPAGKDSDKPRGLLCWFFLVMFLRVQNALRDVIVRKVYREVALRRAGNLIRELDGEELPATDRFETETFNEAMSRVLSERYPWLDH